MSVCTPVGRSRPSWVAAASVAARHIREQDQSVGARQATAVGAAAWFAALSSLVLRPTSRLLRSRWGAPDAVVGDSARSRASSAPPASTTVVGGGCSAPSNAWTQTSRDPFTQAAFASADRAAADKALGAAQIDNGGGRRDLPALGALQADAAEASSARRLVT